MNKTLDIRAIGLSAAVAVLLCLILSVASPSGAKAETITGYCNNQVKGAFETCWGEARTLFRVYGYGDQHSVCVGTSAYTYSACSGGPGKGVYAPVGYTAWLYPWIQNNAAGSNRVHGVAFGP
jgi:hypothetical protein